jgi:hypothetical protein
MEDGVERSEVRIILRLVGTIFFDGVADCRMFNSWAWTWRKRHDRESEMDTDEVAMRAY